MFDLKKYQETQAAIQKTAELRKAAREAALNVPPELQGLLPIVEGDPGNKLPLSLHGVENEVLLREVLYNPTGTPNRPLSVQLLWDGAPVGEIEYLTTPIDPDDLPVSLYLPAIETQSPGGHKLGYISIYVSNEYYGPEVEIIIDKDPPNHGAPGDPLELPDVVDNILDKQYFESNEFVTVSIPRPSDRATGDTAYIYFGRSNPGAQVGIVTATDNSADDLTVDIPIFNVVSSGEGDMIFYYVWEDRVGNVGFPSKELHVIVLLTNAPSGLRPPEVPMAVGTNKTVTVAASFPTLAVQIRQYIDFLVNTDKVVVTFDGVPQPAVTVTGVTDVIVEVPYAVVKRNGVGPREAEVTYKIVRYDSEFPELIGETIEIDLTRPGPPPPEPEDPTVGNPNLHDVHVKGRGTSPPSPEDTLELGDAGQPADASALIYDDFLAGDEVQLFWNGQPVPAPGGVYRVRGDENTTDMMPFVIPWNMIEATSNGKWPVHYEVTSSTTTNPNRSLDTPIDVHVAVTTLPDPVIQGTEFIAGVEYIVCRSLQNISGVGKAAVVHVAGGAPLVDGMVLDFTWSGSNPGGPVPPYPFTKTLSGNEPTAGFDVYLPLATALIPILDGSGSIIYETVVGGRLESSNRHDVEVVVVDGGGGTCPASVTTRRKSTVAKRK
ncbi:hypothetical protein [Pseudomonas sp. MWU12-2345]|uniref:hypothetical protein n=1 Tax=Pseudomonas sp. MWU12-2345 TaxID=2928689 RepID=UPI00200D56B3|nr:hypothetical protein [Pseudomonas sp. MWU12-2345]